MTIPLTTTHNHIIGQVVAYHRKQAGYNQKEFAELMNLSQTTLSHIENGRQVVTVDFLRMAGDQLKIQAWELVLDQYLVVRWLERRGVTVTLIDETMSGDELMKQVALALKERERKASRSRFAKRRK